MRKKNAVPSKYQEQPWLRPEDVCSILGLGTDECKELLSRNLDDKSYSRDFYVGPMNGGFKVEAQSFWAWYNKNHCCISD